MGGEGDMDIWTMQRSSRNSPWGDPQLATTLNSIEKDIPRPPGGGGSIMPLSSERDSVGYYQTYLVTLDPDGRATGEPTLLTELVEPQQSIVDAFLTADALGLFYNQVTENQDAQLYFAWRWDQQGEFAESIALNPVNTPSDDRDPWLSPDENLLFFTTNRRGNDEIFATELQLPPRQ